jgi:hypothetical protein
MTLTHLPTQVQAADTLHAHVAQHDVRVEVFDHPHRRGAADRHPDHFDAAGERREHRLEALDHHLVIVDEHHAHRHGITVRA